MSRIALFIHPPALRIKFSCCSSLEAGIVLFCFVFPCGRTGRSSTAHWFFLYCIHPVDKYHVWFIEPSFILCCLLLFRLLTAGSSLTAAQSIFFLLSSFYSSADQPPPPHLPAFSCLALLHSSQKGCSAFILAVYQLLSGLLEVSLIDALHMVFV